MSRDTDIDFEHHQPRKIDKKKRHHLGFSDDVQEHRQTRVSFKNYMRQLQEDIDAQDTEQWVVESNSGSCSLWEEVAGPFTNASDAYDMLDQLQEGLDRQDEDYSGERFRVTKLEE